MVNAVPVGTHSYTYGNTLGRISSDETYNFAPVAGQGTDGDEYTVELVSTTSACDGGAPGGGTRAR